MVPDYPYLLGYPPPPRQYPSNSQIIKMAGESLIFYQPIPGLNKVYAMQEESALPLRMPPRVLPKLLRRPPEEREGKLAPR